VVLLISVVLCRLKLLNTQTVDEEASPPRLLSANARV
jgi:hypothetical protein